MATIANIDLSGLNLGALTSNMTIAVTTTDINGNIIILCTLTGDFTGYSLTQFIDAVVACINSNTVTTGFSATNNNPKIQVSTDLTGFILAGTTLSLSFGALYKKDTGASTGSEPRGACTVNNPLSPLYGYTFISNYNTNTVGVYNYDILVQNIALGGAYNPSGAAYDPVNDKVIIPCVALFTYFEISNALVLSAPIALTGNSNIDAKYNTFNNYMYIISQGGNGVFKINNAGVITPILGIANSPVAHAINQYNGEIWLGCSSVPAGILYILDPTTNTLNQTIPGAPTFNSQMTFYPGANASAGRMYLINTITFRIEEWSLSGTLINANFIILLAAPSCVFYSSLFDKIFVGVAEVVNGTPKTGINIYNTDGTPNTIPVTIGAPVSAGTNRFGDDYKHEAVFRIINISTSHELEFIIQEIISDAFSGVFLDEAVNDGNCPFCYEYPLIACYDNYVFDLDLTANTVYNIILTDKFGKKHRQQVTSDSDGKIMIDPLPFPDGMFTPENGNLTMEITDANNVPVDIIFGYTLYTCLTLSFEYNNLYE